MSSLANRLRSSHLHYVYVKGLTREQLNRHYRKLYRLAAGGDMFGADFRTLHASGRYQLAEAIGDCLNIRGEHE